MQIEMKQFAGTRVPASTRFLKLDYSSTRDFFK